MMKIIATLIILFATSCSRQPPAASVPSFPERANYYNVRKQLIEAGWSPIPASCGNGYMCFENVPEISTRLSDAKNSGLFVSGNSTIRVHVEPIADGMLLERIEHVR